MILSVGDWVIVFGVDSVEVWATTQTGIAMRLLVIATFLMSSFAGAASASGRYETTGPVGSGVWITDTKTGAVRFCGRTPPANFYCSPWIK